MFIWPDAIPPGAEYLIVVLIPLGVLVIADLPAFAVIQAALILLTLIANMRWMKRKAIDLTWLMVTWPVAYAATTFATNVALLLWTSRH